MQLKKSKSQIENELLDILNYGYAILNHIQSDFTSKIWQGEFSRTDDQQYCDAVDQWTSLSVSFLVSAFPTLFEMQTYTNLMNLDAKSLSLDFRNKPEIVVLNHSLRKLLQHRITLLDQTVRNNISRYDDVRKLRVYIEEIDSFKDVSNVTSDMVIDLLDNGYLNKSEEFIQVSLEEILSVPFHKKDWGGEINDLYTTNLIVGRSRVATAFLLKGNGLKKKTLEIKDCGKNGNQIIRLCDSPAQLFIIQFVGYISEYVIKDIEGKVNELQLQGVLAQYCVIDGQDTARILRAYGKI
jgi:hypothetical protein